MTLEERKAALWAERQQVKDVIDAAYWRFTRQARAVPPSMAEPAAFLRLSEINDELHEIAHTLRSQS